MHLRRPGRNRHHSGTHHRASTPKIAVVIAVAAATVLTACNSSGGAGGNSSSSDATSGSASEEVAAAAAAVKKAEMPPTSIGITTPLNKKPTPGETFVWMNCDIESCKPQTEGAKAAASAAGLQFQQVNYALADPGSLISGLTQALRYHPIAVGLSGLEEAQYASVLPAYKEAGVALINAYTNSPVTDPIIANFNGPEFSAEQASAISNWFIADSQGKGHALLVTVDAVEGLKGFTDPVQSDVKAHCSQCSLTTAPMSFADAFGGKVSSTVIAALQRDPSITYVILPLASISDALPAALGAAGLADKIKIAAQGSDAAALAAVKAGKPYAFVAVNLEFAGWAAVDAALRHEQGIEFDTTAGSPAQLIHSSDQTIDVGITLNEPSDMAEQFKKLWLVG